MKNLNTAGAIIISSIIISAMKILMNENEDAYDAAKVCSGSK